MKARARTAVGTLVLLAAAAGAIAFAWLGEKRGEAEKVKKEANERLFTFDASKVKEVTVEPSADHVKVKIVRANDGWRIAAPIETEADRYAVDALVEKVASLRRKSDIAPAGATGYGLDRPRARVELSLEGGHVATLAIGDENPFDGSVFVRGDGGAVALVAGDAKWSIDRGLFDLREKRLLPFEDKDIRRIDVKAPRLSYALERDGDRWKLAAPIADRADDGTVNRVLGAIRALRANAFVEDPKPDADYGLDRPRYLVKITATNGAVRTLAIGEVAKRGSGSGGVSYGRLVEGRREVATLPDRAAQDLDQELGALRDKTVLAFEEAKVAAARFDAGAVAVEVQKKPSGDPGAGEGWALTSPRAAPADRLKVSRILYDLSSLRADRIADETGVSAARYGLDHPTRVVTLLSAGGQLLGKIEVGKEEGDKAYVRSSAGPRISEVPKAKLAELPRGPEDLEEKVAVKSK